MISPEWHDKSQKKCHRNKTSSGTYLLLIFFKIHADGVEVKASVLILTSTIRWIKTLRQGYQLSSFLFGFVNLFYSIRYILCLVRSNWQLDYCYFETLKKLHYFKHFLLKTTKIQTSIFLFFQFKEDLFYMFQKIEVYG